VTYAVFGDIHGDADKLDKIIHLVKRDYPDVQFFATGDLIDRGTASKDTISLCIEHKVRSVCGNHDLWMRDVFVDNVFDRFALHPAMGGKTTLLSYSISISKIDNNNFEDFLKVPKDHVEYFKSLEKMIVIDDKYILLHSPITPRSFANLKKKDVKSEADIFNKINEMSYSDAANFVMWPSPDIKNRDIFSFSDKIQVFGHKPVPEVMIDDAFIALDTGCSTCKPHKLSCIILGENRIYSV
jgi:hypothetical protein